MKFSIIGSLDRKVLGRVWNADINKNYLPCMDAAEVLATKA